MKKKIKDLTLEERKKICAKQESCDGCPLNEIPIYKLGVCMSFASDLESEVEVDE